MPAKFALKEVRQRTDGQQTKTTSLKANIGSNTNLLLVLVTYMFPFGNTRQDCIVADLYWRKLDSKRIYFNPHFSFRQILTAPALNKYFRVMHGIS